MHGRSKWLFSAGVVALLAAWPSGSRAQDFVDSNSLFAVVRANGTLARGNGAVSSARLATGEYEVIFDQDVRDCAYFADQGFVGTAGTPPGGPIGTAQRLGNDQGVFVNTFNAFAGDPTNRAFHLIVDCDGSGGSRVTTQALWAVVNASGNLVRENGAVSSTNLNTGQYEVVFDRNVRDCTYGGTIGVPGTGTPNVRLITVLDRGSTSAVLVRTQETDGTFDNNAFQVQIDCP